jgi:hypothetical protein
MILLRLLPDATGSQKWKMTVLKLEVHVSQLVDKIAAKFQRQYDNSHALPAGNANNTTAITARRN